jgi:hypothetical protein
VRYVVAKQFLSPHCVELGGEIHISATAPSGGRTSGTYWIGRWVGRRVCVDAVLNEITYALVRNRNLDLIYLCEVFQFSI